jgi:phenylacetate-CoA ligase
MFNPLTGLGMLCHLFGPAKYGFGRYQRFRSSLNGHFWHEGRVLESYQIEQLQKLIIYASAQVPYYTELFHALKIRSADFTSLDALRQLPILSKKMVCDHYSRLLSKEADSLRKEIVTTSGSMGSPLQVCVGDTIERTAFARYRMSTMGISLFKRNVYFRARNFVDRKCRKKYYFDPYWNRLWMSSIGVTHADMLEYLFLLRRFKPSFVRGNPSLVYNLACCKEKEPNLDLRFTIFVSCGENLYEFQREKIQEQFKCEVYNYYSLQEDVVAAFECSKHNGLHIESRKGIVEIVDSAGQVLPNGKTGRIVCTPFYNYVMPLIRYDTGDLGSISTQPCACGSFLPLLETLDGRSRDVIISGDSIISGAPLSALIRRYKGIQECQFVQDSHSQITIHIVKNESFDIAEVDDLRRAVCRVLGGSIKVSVAYVPFIARTAMGKFRFIVNRMNAAIDEKR